MDKKKILEQTINVLEIMQTELKEREIKCKDGRMLTRIGHRISAIHKVKHYIKQRIKGHDIPDVYIGWTREY